jgi:hypothetical protein
MATNDFGYIDKKDLFLKTLYDKNFNSEPKRIFHFVNTGFNGFHYYDDIGKELGFDQNLSEKLAYSLMEKSMIISSTINKPAFIAIRDKGIDYVEKKNRESNRPAIPHLQVNTAERANVQVNINSDGNVQDSFSGNINYNDIDKVLSLVERSYDILELSIEHQKAINHEIDIIRKELKTDYPDKSVVEKSKKIIIDLLTQTGGDLLSKGLIFLISSIPNIVSHIH